MERSRTTPEQSMKLLEFLEIHGDLSTPMGCTDRRIRADFLWTECTELLNSVAGGVVKTKDKWKKVWADLKSKTKKKALIRNKIVTDPDTDNTGSAQRPWTKYDERVLALLTMRDKSPVKEVEYVVSDSASPFELPEYVTDSQDNVVFMKVNRGSRPTSPERGSPCRVSLLDFTTPASPQPASPPPDSLPASPTPASPAASPPPASPPASPPTSPTPHCSRLTLTTPPPTQSRHQPKTRSSGVSTRRRARCRPSNPYERARDFTALEFRRLELEEMRERMQHEREMRTLDIERERVKLFSSLVGIAQAWFECYREQRSNRQ